MGYMSRAQRIARWIEQDGLCLLCREAIPESDLFNGDLVSIDHDVPRAHGGSDDLSNLNVAHVPCNNVKGCGCSGALCEFNGRVLPSPRRLAKRHHAWRRQGHMCYLCNVVILPSELADVEAIYYEFGRVYHDVCRRRRDDENQ